MSVLEDCLKGALSQILEVEMKAAYEDLWTEIVYLKPPWALEDVLQCFRKHWIAVFGNLVPRGLLQSVEALCDFLISGKTVERASTVVAICEARELLQAFSCRSEYCGCVSPALSSLDGLLQRIHPQPERSSEENHVCDGDTLMAEEEEEEEPKQTTPPRASNQEVWSLFEHIWTNVCQIRSAVFAALGFDLGTMEMSQPQDGAPPPQEALSCLHNLSSAVTHLLQAFSRVLSADSSLDDTQTLLTFIFTSQIAAMEPRFSAEDLKECLSQPEYREKLCVGGNQLAELSGTLERCSEAVARRSASTAWL